MPKSSIEMRTPSAQAAQRSQRRLGIGEQQRLGYFDLQPAGIESCLGKRRLDLFEQVAVAELDGRQVDRHPDVIRPLGGRAACLAQNPFADRHDESGLLGDRYELHRRNAAALRTVPAQKRLKRADPLVLQIEQRLETSRNSLRTSACRNPSSRKRRS